jgi:hypothetical protein
MQEIVRPETPSYEEYKPLLNNMVYNKSQASPHVDLHELRAKADDAFLEAVKTWNPEMSAFKTYLVNRVRYKFKKMRQNTIPRIAEHYLPTNSQPQQFKLVETLDMVNNLSATTRKLVIFIFHTTEVVLNKRNIRQYLGQKGWPLRTIDNCFIEISQALNGIYKRRKDKD